MKIKRVKMTWEPSVTLNMPPRSAVKLRFDVSSATPLVLVPVLPAIVTSLPEIVIGLVNVRWVLTLTCAPHPSELAADSVSKVAATAVCCAAAVHSIGDGRAVGVCDGCGVTDGAVEVVGAVVGRPRSTRMLSRAKSLFTAPPPTL